MLLKPLFVSRDLQTTHKYINIHTIHFTYTLKLDFVVRVIERFV